MDAQPSTDRIRRLVGVLWGTTKVGKTTYLMSLPGRKLYVMYDPDGDLTIAYRDDFDIIDLTNLDPSEAIKQGQKVAGYILNNAGKYQSVILDSTTTLVEASLKDAVSRHIGKSDGFLPTLEQPGLNGYGARTANANDVIDRILRATSKTGMHFWCAAHTDDPEYDKAGKTIIRQTMMLPSKIRNVTGLKVSEIWHMATGTADRRTIYLSPYGVKEPMGSRIFDTSKVQKFTLNYDPDVPDEEQPSSLASIIKTWEDGGRRKMIKEPT